MTIMEHTQTVPPGFDDSIPVIRIQTPSSTRQTADNDMAQSVQTLRKFSIIFVLLGILFLVPYCVLTYPDIVMLVASCIFCVVHVTRSERQTDNGAAPARPGLSWILGDVVFTVLLVSLGAFTLNLTVSAGVWQIGNEDSVWIGYGALFTFFCAVLHAWAACTQLLVRNRQRIANFVLQNAFIRNPYHVDAEHVDEVSRHGISRVHAGPSTTGPTAVSSAVHHGASSPAATSPEHEVAEGRHNSDLFSLPFKAHPLWAIRSFGIVIGLLGIVCSWDMIWYSVQVTAALIASALFCILDLLFYAKEKQKHPGQDPAWPRTTGMVCEFLLAGVLFVLSWYTLEAFNHLGSWIENIEVIRVAYAALAAFLCCILHCWAIWRQSKARHETSHLTALRPSPCPYCTPAGERVQRPEAPQIDSAAEHNENILAGRRDCQAAKPASVEAAMEEGLLSSSELNTDYGSVASPDPVTEQPDDTIVSRKKKNQQKNDKGKGKGRSDGWSQTS